MQNLIRRAILAIALIAGIAPAIAQVPPPVPALPDTPRITSYSLTSSTCACNVNFAIYGDSTDYQNWVEVWLNGAQLQYNDPVFGWTITSPTGPLATIPRPVTDGVLTFNTAQTGTVIVVGALRPRRTSQFSENQGVSARNLNQAITYIISSLREFWDKLNDMTGRAILGEPGDVFPPLPPAANRAGFNLCFNSSGAPALCAIASGSGTIASGTGITFTGTSPTTISTNLVNGTGIAIAPSGAAEQVSLGNMNADSFWCNPTGSSAAPQMCTSAQLVALGIAPAAFINTFVVNHPISTTDCGGVVQMGTGATSQVTVTLPAVFGSSGACPITLLNGNNYSAGNSRGMILSSFPGNVPYILLPGQSLHLYINLSLGAWVVDRLPGRWPQSGPEFYVANGGSDTSNDCLSPTTACATINHTQALLYSLVDNLNGSPIIHLYGSGTWNECDTFAGQLTGVNVGFIEGTAGQAIWNTSGACAALLIADNAEWETANITFTSGSANGSGIFIHQTAVVDLLAGTNFGAFSGTGAAVGSDHGGFINFDQGGGAVTIGPGNTGTFLSLGPGTQMVGSFTFSGGSPVSIGTFMSIVGAGAMANFSGIAVGGSFTSIGASTCRGPSAFTLGSSLPGGAPTASAGCQSM